jgi:hypothetical protein
MCSRVQVCTASICRAYVKKFREVGLTKPPPGAGETSGENRQTQNRDSQDFENLKNQVREIEQVESISHPALPRSPSQAPTKPQSSSFTFQASRGTAAKMRSHKDPAHLYSAPMKRRHPSG